MTRFRVRYAETDQMGVVYHANYLVWMEMGRTELCREMGFRYADMEDDGVRLVVAEVNCRYLAPARYDDEIEVETSMACTSARMVQFDYQIRLADSAQRLVSGYTKHIFCGPELRPRRLPEKYHRLFGIG